MSRTPPTLRHVFTRGVQGWRRNPNWVKGRRVVFLALICGMILSSLHFEHCSASVERYIFFCVFFCRVTVLQRRPCVGVPAHRPQGIRICSSLCFSVLMPRTPLPPLFLQIFQETTASLDSENRHFDSEADAAKAAAAQHSGRSHKHAETIGSSNSASSKKSKTSSSDGRTRQQKQQKQQQQQQQQLPKHTVAVVEIEAASPNYSVIFRLVSLMNAFGFV
jgi:hypothetical protein